MWRRKIVVVWLDSAQTLRLTSAFGHSYRQAVEGPFSSAAGNSPERPAIERPDNTAYVSMAQCFHTIAISLPDLHSAYKRSLAFVTASSNFGGVLKEPR